MSPTDSFGVHIGFAHRALRRSIDLTPSGLGELHVVRRLPEVVGHGTVELTTLGRGLSYAQGQMRAVGAETRSRIELLDDSFQFVFHLAAVPLRVEMDHTQRPVLLTRADSLIVGPGVYGTLILQPGVAAHEVGLFADAVQIDRCFADSGTPIPRPLGKALYNPGRQPLTLFGNASAAMGLALRQMLTCGLCGSIARVYLEAKVQEIIALRLSQLDGSPGVPRRLTLMRRDMELLEQARYVLLTEYRSPPTISELAEAIGVNRTKLKTGFRTRFGTTIFGFIRSQRMQHALELLRDGNCNVTEAANMVGYSSLSAFASAFKAEFGFCPSTVCKGSAADGCADE